MFTSGFNTEELFILPKVEKGNDLNRFCKLEGVSYSQLVTEVHGIKNRQGKGWHTKLFAGFSNRTH